MKPTAPHALRPRPANCAALALAAGILLPAVTPAAVPSLYQGGPEVPVVDVHTHVFNAHDLPMAGILNALNVPMPVNHALAKVLNNLTPPDDLKGPVPPRPEPGDGIQPASAQPADATLRDETAATLLRNAAAKPNAPASNSLFSVLSQEEREQLLEYVGRPTPEASPTPATAATPNGALQPLSTLPQDEQDLEILAMALEKANFPPGESDAAQMLQPAGAGSPARNGYLAFVGIMTKGNLEVAVTLRNQEYKQVDLFVHHMMDMEKAYDSQPLMPFADQVRRMKTLDQRMAGSFVHFVAFDPFRRGDALDLVKQAVEKEGAIGVKFYPPSGYRAAGNQFPDEPSILQPGSRARWNSRYKGLKPEDLDKLNDDLFEYCEKNEVPVFTHCTPKGFEADTGYGQMADPKYWALVLEKHPELRLCFGHSGGHVFWFAQGSGPAPADKEYSEYLFGKEVVKLCRKYEHVYCEVGYLEQILDGSMREIFKSNLKQQIKAGGTYKFGDKIMYGSDWHMIHKEKNHGDYPNAFNQLFADPELGPWQRAFFSRNAIKYLMLDKHAKSTTDVHTPEQKSSWTNLINRSNATP